MIELTIFRTGGVRLARSTFLPWLEGPAREERIDCPVWSALLRTPDGLILFDTGLHPVHVERPEATFGVNPDLAVTMTAEDAILARLATLGVGAEDIAIVVNSHLHFDHAGNNRAFPNATFIVQADHLAYAKGRANFPGVYWDDPSLTYLPTSGRAQVAAGVEVVPTPGHAPGHQSLVVDLAETGRVVLCGDAAYTRANLERGETPGVDPAAGKDSLALIRSLVRDDLGRAFPSHDAAAFGRWRQAPEVYR
ncbi:MAG TPA: N-acyl homoserine lactonase family protein [Candidatus Limnocylindria bacterium]|nr:N-acyl homoserine lactonase family protein [Candidatus Limnocylindria bacterium]